MAARRQWNNNDSFGAHQNLSLHIDSRTFLGVIKFSPQNGIVNALNKWHTWRKRRAKIISIVRSVRKEMHTGNAKRIECIAIRLLQFAWCLLELAAKCRLWIGGGGALTFTSKIFLSYWPTDWWELLEATLFGWLDADFQYFFRDGRSSGFQLHIGSRYHPDAAGASLSHSHSQNWNDARISFHGIVGKCKLRVSNEQIASVYLWPGKKFADVDKLFSGRTQRIEARWRGAKKKASQVKRTVQP